MTHDKPIYHLARVVIETTTPLSITAGRGDGVFDSQLVRDANGLATLPGSTLAGVLRHRYLAHYGDSEQVETLFGFSPTDSGSAKAHLPSAVQLSWGCVHDSNDRPFEGLALDGEATERLANDPLLRDALEGEEHRDHVRIDEYGTAEETGQFDRVSLRPGHRFSFDIALWSGEAEDDRWTRLMALLAHPAFRLGGATRRGLGGVKVVRLHQGRFDLRDAQGLDAFSRLSRDLGNTEGLEPWIPESEEEAMVAKAHLALEPTDLFRYGTGHQPVGRYDTHEKDGDPDLLPLTSQRVSWRDGRGTVDEERCAVIPGSALKGAIRHRTLYHYQRLTGTFVDAPDEEKRQKTERAMEALFGYADDKNKEIDRGKEGHDKRAGRLLIDDLHLPLDRFQPVRMMHNGVDRFTGGVRRHVLYSEELLMGGELEFDVTLLPPLFGEEADPLEGDKWIGQALMATLQDLADGLLSLGGGAARGHGFFEGTVTWSGTARWLAEEVK